MEGCRLPVRMQGGDDWPLAEIISIKEVRGQREYYVHYVDCKFSLYVCTTHKLTHKSEENNTLFKVETHIMYNI